MALKKNPRVNLKAKYNRMIEISSIISLSFIIAAFKFFPDIKLNNTYLEDPPVIIDVIDVEHTRQEKPLPPPRPNILTAAVDPDDIKDIDLPPIDIDQNAIIDPPPPLNTNSGTTTEPEPFYDIAEVMPEPVGGLAAIQKKIVYPEMAIRIGIQGKVYVRAYIDSKGNVTKAEIVKGAGAGLDEAALKAVKETKFSPGKQRGKPLNVKVTIPVVFKLR